MSAPSYNSIECPVVTWRPNWATPPRLLQEYATLVYEKLDLSEERLQQRPRCLFGITYDVTTFGPRETGSARRFFETLPTTPVGVPFWMDAVVMSAAVSAGAGTIPITDGDDRLFSVLLGYCLVWESWDKYEVIAFAGLTTTEVSLSDTLVNSYPVGSLVVPLAFGKIKRPEFRQITGSHSEFTVEFMEYFHALPGVPQILPELTWLPEPELTETTCHDEFTIAISNPGVATIMAAPSRYGDYVEIMVTNGETDAVTINNDFAPWDGSWWFRVEYEGGYKTRPVNPAGPNVKPPQIVMGTTQYPTPLSELGFPTDLFSSVAQLGENNPLIQPDPLAIRITARYQYTNMGLTDEILSQRSFLPLVNRESSGNMTWRTDKTDPKTSTSSPYFQSGIYDMYNGPYGFACIIKARTKIGVCWSPMTMVLVDVRINPGCFGLMRGSSAAGPASDEPCEGLTGTVVEERIKDYLCAMPDMASWDSSQALNIFSCNYSITGTGDHCSVGWTGGVYVFDHISSGPAAPFQPVHRLGFVEIDGAGGVYLEATESGTIAELASDFVRVYTYPCGHVDTGRRVTSYLGFYTTLPP